MADEKSDYEPQDFKRRMIDALAQGTVVNRQCLSMEDVEGLVEDLGPLIRPLLIELRQTRFGEQRLGEQLQLAELRASTAAAEFGKDIATLQRQIAAGLADVMRARLLEAEVDEALRRAGYEYPVGIRGVRDALGHLKMYREDARARYDYLTEIADVATPEDEQMREEVRTDPEAAKRAVEQIGRIIQRWDDSE